jgi:hypothetical protein
MLPWLLKLDPNVVVPVLLTVGGWLYHKIAGKNAETLERIVAGVIGSILSEIVDHVPSSVPVETYLKGARLYVEDRVWKVLQKRGVPKNATTEKLVHMALEEAVNQLGKKLAEERRKQAEAKPLVSGDHLV